MIPLGGLGVIVLVLGTGAGPLLSRGRWCQRLPRVAVLAWLGVLAGALAAMVGVVVMVSAGRHGLVHRAAEWLRRAAEALRVQRRVLADGDYATVAKDPRVIEAYIGAGRHG